MNTEVKNFPRGKDVNDLLFLIYGQLKAIAGLLSPVSPVEVTDITAVSGTVLDALNPGDVVIKKTGTAGHSYRVSYKDAENGGLCLTYVDASVVETVSYDHTESGWVYNSTDITPIVAAVSDNAPSSES